MGKIAPSYMRYPQTEVEPTHRTPIVVTPEDYERDWKPKGWKLIIIGPTATWREDWGEWEAIRDVVQNCLDEADAYTYGYDHQGLWIADKGSGVAVEDFLLGPPKLKPEWARGKFGEGMKIAALALLRMGHSVHVQTVNREIWVVFSEQVTNGRVKTLAALWKKDGTRAGTRFHIIGYRGSAYPGRFAVNIAPSAVLFKAASDIQRPKQRYNQLFRTDMIAKETGEEGLLYCRDIFFKTIKSMFSYNLWGFRLAPDRHGPERERDMWNDAGRLWAMCDKVPLLAQLIPMISDPPLITTDETRLLIFDDLGMDPITGKSRGEILVNNAHLWKQAWDKVYGGGAVLRTSSELDNMVEHLGYKSEGIQWGLRTRLDKVIKTDFQLVQEMNQKLMKTIIVPDHQLTTSQLVNLDLARAIAKDWTKGPVNAARIPRASDRVERTAGTYEFGSAIINIDLESLNRGDTTIGTVIHEIAHDYAYNFLTQGGSMEHRRAAAEDLTETHAKAIERVSGRVTKDVALGKYDEQLKSVIW